jgi:FMN phosphatase YigB (HAD superfamily)
LIATAIGNNIQLGFSFSTIGKRISRTQTLWHPKKHFKSALSSLNFAQPEEKEDNKDDYTVARWEEMYQQGTETRQQQIYAMNSAGMSGTINTPTIKNPVRVVTFDLDNTLWKTGPTISAANDALADYLSTKKNDNDDALKIPTRIEKVMGDLFHADRRRYCPLVGATIPDTTDDEGENMDELLEQILKSPVLLTQLRIDALCYVLETENDFTAERALSFSEDAFDVWTQARHDAILEHMAPSVVDTLNEIRTAISSSTGNDNNGVPVLIGAVTDGNSDPRKLEILAPYFDFCVNAESVGVSKPDKRVYLQAIRQAITLRPDIFSDLLPMDDVGDFDNGTLENIVGPYWCHIGDDFLKDIVAAKDMNMRTIFAVGLIKDKLLADEPKSGDSEMDMAEFLKKVSSQTIVTLGIGADDYLANALHGEFVDEVAHDFSDIGKILLEWHKEAADSAITTDTSINGKKEQHTEPPPMATTGQDQEQTILEVIEPSPSTADTGGLPVTPIANKNEQGEVDFILPRAFRIIREDCSVDIPAPLRKRDERTMKEVMGMAQREKSSGVFAFNPADVASLNDGKKVLMIAIGGAQLEFSRDMFSNMSVEEILGLTDENPVKLSLYMTKASDQESFDLF